MLFLTFLFHYHVVNAQKYKINKLTNVRAINSLYPLSSPIKPMTSRLIVRFLHLRIIAVHLQFDSNVTSVFALSRFKTTICFRSYYHLFWF